MADLQSVAVQAAQANGIPPDFFLSLIGNGENGFNDPGTSPKGATGPAQLMPGTAAQVGVDPRNPVQNIIGGARYAGQLWKKYGGDPVLTAAAYNAGPGAVDQHKGVPPYPETQAYVQRVTGGMDSPMPSPDQVMGGYGGKSQPQPSSPAAAPHDDAALPSPSDVLNGYQSQKPGTGRVTYPGGQAVNLAQENAVLSLQKAGRLDLTQPRGSNLNPYVEANGVPVPQGAAKVDLSGQFTPQDESKPLTGPTSDPTYTKSVSPGQLRTLAYGPTAGKPTPEPSSNPVANFAHDYRARVGAAGNALQADLTTPLAPKDYLGADRVAQTTGDTLNYLFGAPVAAAFDTVVGRPVNALSGGRIPVQTAGNVASLAVPMAGELADASAVARAARAAGVSIEGYKSMLAARNAAQDALAAQNTVPKQPGVVARATAPIRAAVSKSAAETQAGQTLASRASDLDAVKANLATGTDEIVPGSVPTTAQQTGDMGLLALEREQATKNPEAFRTRAREQDAVRVTALNGVQSGGDRMDLANGLRQQLADLDARTDQAVQDATKAAQDKAQAIGGNAAPEAYGADVRGAVTAAQDASKQAYGALYKAVDPDGTLTANVTGTKTAAKEIPAAEPPTAAPIQGEEAGIYDAAQNMPDIAPARDLMALKVRVNDAAADALASGNSAAYARLSRFRSALQDNIATTISDRIAQDDAAVARGTMASEDAFRANLASQLQEWRAIRARAGGNPGGNDLGVAGGRAPGVRGSIGAESQGSGGPPNAPGGPGLQGETPSFDAAAAQRLKAADAAYAQHAQTFGVKPLTPVTRTNGYQGQFLLPNGAVPGKFFHPGPTGFNDMQALQKAAPEAMPIIEDYAASSLRRAAQNPDGTIEPGRFERWKAAHQDALRALPPETQARFADAAEAGRALAEAAANRNAALKAAQQGAVGKILGLNEPSDVTRGVGGILGGRTAVQDMRALATAAKRDPNAFQGLRQAVADHIAGKLIGNTEVAASGQAGIKADQYQTFMRQNRAALAQVFTPEELNRLDAIARDIQRAKRSENAIKLPGGSNTPQDMHALRKVAPAIGRSLLNVLAIGEGFHQGGGFGMAVGYGVGTASTDAMQTLRAAGISRVDELVTRAMLDPEVARALLAKVPMKQAGPSKAVLQGRVNTLLRALQANAAVASTAPQTRPRNALAH